MDDIRQLLQQKFNISYLDVIDESHKHAGHAEAKKHGGGHYFVHIESLDFAGKSRVDQQKMVYQALEPLWAQQKIHALRLKVVAHVPSGI